MGWEKVSHSDVKDKHTQGTMVSKEEGSCVAWRRVGAWLHRLLLSLEWSHAGGMWGALNQLSPCVGVWVALLKIGWLYWRSPESHRKDI